MKAKYVNPFTDFGYIDTAFDEGKIEGEIEEKIKIIKNLITEFGFTDQQAAQAAKVSVDFVENIRKELNK